MIEDRYVHAHPNGFNGPRDELQPKRIVIHSTRSGVTHSGWTQGLEMSATLNHFQSPNSYVATHLVISPAEIVRCLDNDIKGHHAGTYQWNESFGIELTQPTIDTPYEQGHYDNLGKALEYLESLGYSLHYDGDVTKWLLFGGIIFHEDLTTHKSDPGYQFDLEKTREEEEDMTEDEVKKIAQKVWKDNTQHTNKQFREHVEQILGEQLGERDERIQSIINLLFEGKKELDLFFEE